MQKNDKKNDTFSNKIYNSTLNLYSLAKQLKQQEETLPIEEKNKINDKIYSVILAIYSNLCYENREQIKEFEDKNSINNKRNFVSKIIELNNTYIKIKTPILYRKNKPDTIIVDDLLNALYSYVLEKKQIPNMEYITIRFTHFYNENTSMSLVRDNDNYITKGIINLIVGFLNTTDRGDRCWIEYRTEFTKENENYTIIEVFKRQ